MKAVYLSLFLLILTSCVNGNNTGSQDQKVPDGEFRLTQIGQEDLSSEDLYFEFVDQEKIMFGNTGCNALSTNYSIDGSEIAFTAPVSTRKFCEGKMETEQKLHSALEETIRFRSDGKDFVFLSGEDEPLIALTKTNSSE